MQAIKSNWPTILMVAAVVALFVAQNKGVLTSEQVGQVMAFLGITGVFGAHRAAPPVKA